LNLIGAESPEVGQPALPTHSLRLRFPAGDVDFSPSELKGFGRLVSCSLFSPMSEFFDQLAARAAVATALGALFDPHLHNAPERPRAPDEKLDRRALLIGRRCPPRGEVAAR
jgi:[NiFe] hydrogenase assembly HybE family chaperone